MAFVASNITGKLTVCLAELKAIKKWNMNFEAMLVDLHEGNSLVMVDFLKKYQLYRKYLHVITSSWTINWKTLMMHHTHLMRSHQTGGHAKLNFYS